MNEKTGFTEGLVPLRGHHLFCLHFFEGEGYSPEFIDRLRVLMERAAADGVVLVEGADAVCRACPGLVDGVCEAQDEVGRIDAVAAGLLKARTGDAFDWDDLRERLPDTLDAWYIAACEDCDWLTVCSSAGLRDLCDTAAEEAEAELG